MEPWRYIYAILLGPDVEPLLHSAGLGKHNVVFDFSLDEEMLHDLHAMCHASSSAAAKYYDVVAYFLLAMSRLIQACTDTPKKVENADQYFIRAIAYMDDFYASGISMNDVANVVNIDRTYLYRIFMHKDRNLPRKIPKRTPTK